MKRRYFLVVFSCLLTFIILIGCISDVRDVGESEQSSDFALSFLRTEGSWILDEQNRVVILRGPQIIERNAPYISFHTEEDYDRLLEWGFNAIRFGIFWAAVEPAPDFYDENFLLQLDERVRWAKKRGIYVILDMHQDLYSEKYSGDGAPLWACLDDNIPFKPLKPWFLNYFHPAVIKAFDNLWNNTDGIQEHFIRMWTYVAARYAKEPAIAGYDLFNEPYLGSLFLKLKFKEFEQKILQPFYERLIGAMRAVDKNHIYFVEPSIVVGAGLPCHLENLPFPNLAYAPHAYHVLANFFSYYPQNPNSIERLLRRLKQDADRMNVPLWIGEFALFSADTVNGEQYMKDICRIFDEYAIGWSYWVYAKDDNVGLLDQHGNERTWILDIVSRTYPQRIAGFPIRFFFEPDTKHFEMTWQENPAAFGPTVIFIPKERHYPNGFVVSSSDESGRWSYEWNDERNLLKVWADRTVQTHTLTIDAK